MKKLNYVALMLLVGLVANDGFAKSTTKKKIERSIASSADRLCSESKEQLQGDLLAAVKRAEEEVANLGIDYSAKVDADLVSFLKISAKNNQSLLESGSWECRSTVESVKGLLSNLRILRAYYAGLKEKAK